ncbi:MAG: DUF89 family protein [Candidatus Omnitrophica bacterium]|nr:DUF89 family protein [Candidatus Omnitrophota bacterium]
MRTYPECLICFERQARDASRLAGLESSKIDIILREVTELLTRVDPRLLPPEIARSVYGLIDKHSGINDVYKELKKKSNKLAMSLYDELIRKIDMAEDKILMGIRMAVAGNVIDYGLPHVFDVKKELDECVGKDFAVFDYEDFRRVYEPSKKILYILDNAGEIVFDKMLISLMNKHVTAAVRERPIINDVTIEDAKEIGLERISRVISSGSGMPGTILAQSSEEFKKCYRESDMVISKGQGNYETFSGNESAAIKSDIKPVFFLFKAKCPVVARHAGCELGDIVLKYEDKKLR